MSHRVSLLPSRLLRRIFFYSAAYLSAMARYVELLSDSVVPYRAIYSASMANGRHIDNSELHTLFTRVYAAAFAHITYNAATMRGPKNLIGVAVSLLIPLRKGPSTTSFQYCRWSRAWWTSHRRKTKDSAERSHDDRIMRSWACARSAVLRSLLFNARERTDCLTMTRSVHRNVKKDIRVKINLSRY